MQLYIFTLILVGINMVKDIVFDAFVVLLFCLVILGLLEVVIYLALYLELIGLRLH